MKTFARECLALTALLLVKGTGAAATELKLLSPIALKPVVEAAGPELTKSTGDTIAPQWGETGGMRADIEKGAAFDVAVLTENFVDDLISKGKLDAKTKTPLARSGIGVAVKKGEKKPDVSTVDAFRRAMLDAKSIGFVDQSASSRYLPQLFSRLGIAEEVKAKLVPLTSPLAKYVASGEVEIALTQISTIVPFPEIEMAGPLPEELQRYTVFVAAGPHSDARTSAALKALTSPAARATLKGVGLEPSQ